MYQFGAGSLYSIPSAVGGTPIKFGAIQDVSIDFSFNTKELHGTYQFPLAVARGTGKVTGKCKAATINGLAFNNLFFGQTLLPGETTMAVDEAHSIPGSSSYVVDANNASAFVDDNGVVDMTTGLQMTRVTVLSALGQYTVTSGGVYTFYSGDAGKAITINYTYSTSTLTTITDESHVLTALTPPYQVPAAHASLFVLDSGVKINSVAAQRIYAGSPTAGQYYVSPQGVYTFSLADVTSDYTALISYKYAAGAGTGKNLVISNQLLGTTPVFQATFTTTFLGKQVTFVFPNCVGSKLAFATKLEDYVIPEYDFSVFANAGGQICTISTDE